MIRSSIVPISEIGAGNVGYVSLPEEWTSKMGTNLSVFTWGPSLLSIPVFYGYVRIADHGNTVVVMLNMSKK